MKKELESKLLNEEESFENDLGVVNYEYQLWGQHITDKQDQLIAELRYAVGEHKENIIKKLHEIDRLVLEWNTFVESIIRKYSKEKKYVRQLEIYMYQPQR